jgi:hypothetical protein
MSVELVLTSSVRAILGVSSKELPDTVLTNPIYAVRLREDLRDLNTQLVADFASIGALTTRTDDQERFVELASTYAAYHVANQCLGALPMFSPLTLKDEKAELTRNVDAFKGLREDVSQVMNVMKTRLQNAYAKINSAAPAPNPTARTLLASVGLATDPVTGAG